MQFYFIHINRQRELLSIPVFITSSVSELCEKYQDHKLDIQHGLYLASSAVIYFCSDWND